MLLIALSSWVFVEKRSLVQLVPERVQELWSNWELRVLVLISLALQISLIHFGSRRKYNVKSKIRIFLWFAYLLADWLATVALGVLSQNQGEDSSCDTNKKVSAGPPLDDELSCFWAPFLLLHLGGPDSITAYALEDNELWLRHLLGLVVQVSVASYIFIMSWKSSLLPCVTIPMLLAGLIKYVERTLALRSAKQSKFRESMLSPADPGPSYVKFMELVSLKRDEGYSVETEEINDEVLVPELDNGTTDGHDILNFDADEVNIVVKAHELFRTFRRLFVDVILSFQERDSSQLFFQNLNPDIAPTTAFKIVETELGYAYDVFYTKAPVIYTRWGFMFRAISFCTTCIVFLCFQWLLKVRHKNWIDLIITYVLLGGAIIIEIYAFVLIASSDWTTLWLSRHLKKRFPRVITCVQVANKQRWSNSMAQINLLSYCLKRKPKKDWPLQDWFFRSVLQKFDENLDKILYLTREPFSDEFKCLIFKHLLDKSNKDSELHDIVSSRGNLALKKYAFPDFEDWTTKVEFDQSILLWHIATDLCYDHEPADEDNEDRKLSKQLSKHIADYMMYLLVMCPFMLPKGIGMMRFADTCEEAKEVFAGRNITSSDPKSNVCKMLLAVNTEIEPAQVKGDRSKSVLFDACILASSLNNQKERKWEILREVWIEMLAYAASHCAGNYHAQQLRRGGELLTHVWLLMAHLGLTDQLQISKGHARVKLILS